MKKLILVVVAIMAMIAMAIPAMPVMANGVHPGINTSVTIGNGGGEIPVVKCKWEQEPDNNLHYPAGETAPSVDNYLESGDTTHILYPDDDPAFSQFNPPMHKNATKTIQYFAVVTDAEDMGDVANVFALVFHPLDSPAPYNTYAGSVPDPGPLQSCYVPYFKYKIEFTNLGNNAAQINQVLAANNAHLIKFADGYDINEVAGLATSEMNKHTANLWMGEAEIDYEQPGGYYTVQEYAIDTNNNYSTCLENQFLYIKTAGVEVDFNSFNYGPINLHFHTIRAGDLTWNTPSSTAGYGSYGATVRNIGNVWAKIQITQNDMGFGDHSGSNPNTTYQGTNPPTAAESNWNVYYDLRLGSTGDEMYYDPDVTLTTPEYLPLSSLEELDFSIIVNQGQGTHRGTMVISAIEEPFSGEPPYDN